MSRKRSAYSDEVIEFAKANCKDKFTSELTQMINDEFGTSYTVAQIKSLKARYKMVSGKTFSTNGISPTNKGVKMAPEHYERLKKYMFKKGEHGSRNQPIGSEKVDKDGYILVKVTDEIGSQKNWMSKHKYIYESIHGPIPKDCVVIFADGNNRNFDPDNLVLVTRAELLRLNQYKRIFGDAELTKTAVLVTKLELAVYEKKKGKKKNEEC